ncbi:MAG: hypothetical protein ACTSUV_05925 [Candidatus Ranarchaeia archaeon]
MKKKGLKGQVNSSLGLNEQIRKKVPRSLKPLFDVIQLKGKTKLSDLGNILERTEKDYVEDIRKLQKKNLLTGWFTRKEDFFVTEKFLSNIIIERIRKGIVEFIDVMQETGLTYKIINQTLNKIIKRTKVQGLHTLDKKKYITALHIWLITEEQLLIGKVNITSIASQLKTAIDGTYKLMKDIIKNQAPTTIFSGMVILSPKYLTDLRKNVEKILEEEGRIKIENLKLDPSLRDLTPPIIDKILQRLCSLEKGSFNSDKTEFYTEKWQSKMEKKIIKILSTHFQVSTMKLTQFTRLKNDDLVPLLINLVKSEQIYFSGPTKTVFNLEFVEEQIISFLTNRTEDIEVPTIFSFTSLSKDLGFPNDITIRVIPKLLEKNRIRGKVIDKNLILENSKTKQNLINLVNKQIVIIRELSEKWDLDQEILRDIIQDLIDSDKINGLWLPGGGSFCSIEYLEKGQPLTKLFEQLESGNALSISYLKDTMNLKELEIFNLFNIVANHKKKKISKIKDRIQLKEAFEYSCQMCDSTNTDSRAYYQCVECKRYLCPTCKSLLPQSEKKCPNCNGGVIRMPLKCEKCNIVYNDLTTMQGEKENCPSCGDKLQFYAIE